ncbi:MAG: extracellular solute-binding protein, partial [Chloroflexia bacterium]|nr:extracellular solute-binding protein [Chloroflexia bacterium]
MKSQTTRRRLLQASGGALASVSLLRTGSIGRGAAARQATIEIRAAGFVESQDQLRQTLAVLEAYTAQHPEVAIQPEFTDYGSYTDRLATEAAGGNAPDLMSANADIMGEYSRRGVIRPLDEYVPDPIDLSDYAEGTVVGNTIDGSLFGIPNDCISPSLVYDTTVFAEAGITVPEQMWTWEEYAQLATDLSAAMGEGFYGTE